MNLLLDREQIDERLVDPRVGVVAPRVQEAPERILHRAGRRRVDVALGRRQMDDVLAEEEIGNVDAFGIDALQHAHRRLRLVGHPRHVFFDEVVEDRDAVAFDDRHVVIQILALEGVGDDRLVLNADLIGEPAPRQRLNRPFELPRRRVRRRERKVPRDVVLENRRLAGIEGDGDAREIDEAIDVGKDGLGRDAENRNPRRHLPLATCVFSTTGSPAYC